MKLNHVFASAFAVLGFAIAIGSAMAEERSFSCASIWQAQNYRQNADGSLTKVGDPRSVVVKREEWKAKDLPTANKTFGEYMTSPMGQVEVETKDAPNRNSDAPHTLFTPILHSCQGKAGPGNS